MLKKNEDPGERVLYKRGENYFSDKACGNLLIYIHEDELYDDEATEILFISNFQVIDLNQEEECK